MLPGEHETRRKLRKKFATDFELAREVLALAYGVHDSLGQDKPRRFGRLAKAVSVAGLTKLCNQFRSIHALCELGLTDDADIVLRAMFETALRLEFVIRRKPTFRHDRRLPPRLPSGRLTVNFRAKLLKAQVALQLKKCADALHRIPRFRQTAVQSQADSDQRANNATAQVGHAWIDWLKTGPMFGLSVEVMARNLGLGDWYDAVYRPLCLKVHASDYEQFLEIDVSEGTITARLFPDDETTTLPVEMGTGVLVDVVALVDDRFRLGFSERIQTLSARVRGHPWPWKVKRE